jgi:hypothetical protein
MGKVVNPDIAFKVCDCYQTGATEYPEDMLCYSRGVLGALNNAQDRACEERHKLVTSKKFDDNAQRLVEVSKGCKILKNVPDEEKNTYMKGGKKFIVRDYISRSKCILAKFEELGITELEE